MSRAHDKLPGALLPEDVCLIIGKRGKGKSTTAKEILRRQLEAGARVVAFDPHDEYSRRGVATDQVRLGELRDRVSCGELFERPDLLDNPRLSLAVVPDDRMPKPCSEDFKGFVQLVMTTGRGIVCFVDEVGIFSDYCQDELDYVATQSRHASMPLVLVAQRAVQIPKTARSQASLLVSLRQDEPADLDALRSLTTNTDPTYADRVGKLKKGECEVWRDSD